MNYHLNYRKRKEHPLMTKYFQQTLKSDSDASEYIFISDIHGNLETLSLIDQALADHPEAQLVTGGDYVDGRDHVKDVLEYLMKKKEQGAIIIKGNHEQMLLNFANHEEHQDGIWFYNGGKETLKQLFGKVASLEEIQDSKYYEFLSSLPMMYETPNYIFVHAGVRSDEHYDDPSTYAHVLDVRHHHYTYDFYRIWARQNYWYSDQEQKIFAHNQTGKTIVTGHTPTARISGQYDNGKTINSSALNPVKEIKYDNEPGRIFTDGGSHSDPKLYPHNDGNVVVLDQAGKIKQVYNYENTLK